MKVVRFALTFGFIGALSLGSPTAHAVPSQGPNGNFYEFVGAPGSNLDVDFQTALANAASMTFNGATGFLATITDQAEQDFVQSLIGRNQAWLGGSDAASEGVWEWITGPEAGTVFWNGGSAGSSPTFAAWGGNQPDDANGAEDFLHTRTALSGGWADGTGNNTLGFVVEYVSSTTPPPPPDVIPEPITAMLGVMGLAALGAGLRRRRLEA